MFSQHLAGPAAASRLSCCEPQVECLIIRYPDVYTRVLLLFIHVLDCCIAIVVAIVVEGVLLLLLVIYVAAVIVLVDVVDD